jgi:hypothetical protein
MPVLLRDESWKWLSEIKKAGDPTMLRAIKAFLSEDFEQASDLARAKRIP